ncbi:MAG: phosphoribosylglycinamide formyltransferase [Betaproteobacteria bacterium]|nr:MAG: phosphoribosylglycinamide formyltransferase [Betaproteobacteria bacterium]TMH93455.1 MAG: phosphoribosylglycinamide formyltransferase [Betaproteobacteria bacterium]
MKSVVILISGRGSNMEAIVRAELPAKVAAVISNRADAPGLKFAAQSGLPVEVVDEREFSLRGAFDAALEAAIERHSPDLVALAGFMRILGGDLVRHYSGRMVNIHPSLLPAFPGLHTHRRALQEGVKLHGCTVHFVTPQVDHGPIIAQAAIPVRARDTEATLAARVLEQEHRIYPLAIRWFVEGRLAVENGIVRVDGSGARQALLVEQ